MVHMVYKQYLFKIIKIQTPACYSTGDILKPFSLCSIQKQMFFGKMWFILRYCQPGGKVLIQLNVPEVEGKKTCTVWWNKIESYILLKEILQVTEKAANSYTEEYFSSLFSNTILTVKVFIHLVLAIKRK